MKNNYWKPEMLAIYVYSFKRNELDRMKIRMLNKRPHCQDCGVRMPHNRKDEYCILCRADINDVYYSSEW